MAEKHDFTAQEQRELKRILSDGVLLEKANEGQEDHERKAKDCINSNDIQRIIDLGLGRGVDTTNPTPWQNKTSFQVRPVTIENIIGTEEGGLVQSYERDVSSVSELRGNASASVTNPKTAVTVGVEGEYSQSSTRRHKVVGTKVLNRTISFKAHCDDANIKLPYGVVSFQTWLCKWILDKRVADLSTVLSDQKRGLPFQTLSHTSPYPESTLRLEGQLAELNSVLSTLSIYIGKAPEESESEHEVPVEWRLFELFAKHIVDKEVIDYCNRFITQFHITHYVSSIQLGASGYEVVSESTAAKKLGAGGRVGVEKIATGSAGASYGNFHSKKAKDVHRIGVIGLKENIPVVERGTHDEAVIGIQIKPVSDLVKIPELRKPLQAALVQYIKNETEVSSGPFKVRCTPQQNLYLKVNTNSFTLTAIYGKAFGSNFYLKPCSNSDKHPNEFLLCYYNTPDETKTVDIEHYLFEPIPYYLQTPVNILGTNDGPLQFRVYNREKDCRLVLQSSLVKRRQPHVSLSAWMSGKEMCFIKCARRRSKNAFISVLADRAIDVHCTNSLGNATLFQIVQTDATWQRKSEQGEEPQISHDLDIEDFIGSPVTPSPVVVMFDEKSDTELVKGDVDKLPDKLNDLQSQLETKSTPTQENTPRPDELKKEPSPRAVKFATETEVSEV